LVNLTALIAFWKRKEPTSAPESERVIPLPQLPAGPAPEPSRTTSMEEANRARESLKVLRLERQIIGSALTTIYESQTKGVISQTERDRLLSKYKGDLDRLEKSIDDNQRIVDLFELENAREALVRDFRTRLAEIDTQLKNLKTGGPVKPISPAQAKEAKPASQEEKREESSSEAGRKEQAGEKAKEKKPPEDKEQEISEAEKRVNQIREEILKAMDRLEQIEAEG
jgi:hypothetical protein